MYFEQTALNTNGLFVTDNESIHNNTMIVIQKMMEDYV